MSLRSTARQLFIFLFCVLSFSYSALSFALQNKLVDYVYLGEFSRTQATLALQKLVPLNTLEIKHTLALYKIHYQTLAPDGKITLASGLAAMPVTPQHPVGIVAFLHGTRVMRSDSPSRNDEKNYVYQATFSSSGGYMLVMPDYLGLGDNDLPLHPYVESETLASSSIDMLIAAKEMAAALAYPVSDKLFLAGYSEGGFSTMVTYEELLKNHKELPVTAAAPGSAPYDWDVTMRFVALQPGPRSTVYLAYFFYSLQTYHHYWNGLDEVFRKPYDTLIPALYDGTHQLPELLQALPADPSLIFNTEFFQSIVTGTNRATQQLKLNFNHYDFTSTSPLLLVGSKGDKDVPYHGSELAYEVLKRKSDLVTIKKVSDEYDHIQAATFVMKEQLAFFKQYG